MEPRISIITLGVSDMQRSIRFYQDGLRLPLRESAEEIAFFETSGTWLALHPRSMLAQDAAADSDGQGFPGFTLAHNVRTSEEVDQLLNEAADAGGKVVKKGEAKSWGGYSGYFSDPDGFLWEVAWNPHFWID